MPAPTCRPRSGLRIGVASSVVLLLGGCASTTGRGWVGEAQYEPSSVIDSSQAQHASIPATAEPEEEPDVRPRLNHTVTLGEIDVAPAARGADPATGAAWGGPSVTINNYNVMNAATPAYGYGYGYVSSVSARTSPSVSAGSMPRTGASGAGTMTPGQSWPTIADHGPSFPYHTGPASPWSRAQ